MPREYVRKHAICDDCGAMLVPQRAWNATPPHERDEMRAEGYQRQGVGHYCSNCCRKKENLS